MVSGDTGAEARAGRQVTLGFEREGIPVSFIPVPTEPGRLGLGGEQPELVIVTGSSIRALDVLARVRRALEEGHRDTAIVLAANGIDLRAATDAGADEVVRAPAYLRDVVTLGRVLRNVPRARRSQLEGNLGDTTSAYALIRAVASLGRSTVLTLVRGLRRGEVRFFEGEVTSAQVGVIHGQAAFHQLLLWTDARYELRAEDVVRRQQIPLSHAELFADAARFLEGVREASGLLSPSMVLDQNVVRINALAKQIPTEVHGVLRMFDGHRVLADVLEDSPYRVFETLRVTQRAVDAGLLRVVESMRPKSTFRAVLALEEWLVGADREAVVARTRALQDTGPVRRDSKPKLKSKHKRKSKRKLNTPPAVPATSSPAGAKPDIDWTALVPRVVGQEVGPLSGVVPAAQRSGELDLGTREAERERLESIETSKREKLFPTDLGLPSVVIAVEPPASGTPTTESTGPTVPLSTGARSQRARAERLAMAPTPPAGMPIVSRDTPAVTVVETPAVTVAVHDTLRVEGSESTAIVTSTPKVTITEAVTSAPVPVESVDEQPSDGVVIEMTSAETAPVRRQPRELPPDDRPKATMGEIVSGATEAPAEGFVDEPSILVADLADAHAAAAAAANAEATAPPSADIASASRELAVQQLCDSAAAIEQRAGHGFDDLDEAFFRAGTDKTTRPATVPSGETFEDLDEGYERATFWERLRGKKPTQP